MAQGDLCPECNDHKLRFIGDVCVGCAIKTEVRIEKEDTRRKKLLDLVRKHNLIASKTKQGRWINGPAWRSGC